jgi:phosphomannomutase
MSPNLKLTQLWNRTSMKEAPLMISTSGLRGIVGKSLTPQVVTDYAAAFGTMLKGGTIVVGRDSRSSGEQLKSIVISTLAMCGCHVIDLGIVPTPSVELGVIYHKAKGGIAITASHNPAEWNALKFFSDKGEFITQKQFAALKKTADKGKFAFTPYDKIGTARKDNDVVERHIKDVLRLRAVKPARIKKAGLKVVIDAINGAGSYALPELCERLGVKVIRINCKGDGDFFRAPEPVPQSLKQLGRQVKKVKADCGLACDPDADRLAIVDEAGRAIGEELTLALAAAYYLQFNPGPVAINLSTSSATADIAKAAGSKVFYSPVGEANVIAEMKKRHAVIGGEGNGGVILPEAHYGRDALVAAGLVLSYLAEAKTEMSHLAATIPAYKTIKKKSSLPRGLDSKLNRVKALMRKKFKKVSVDTRDGVRIDFDKGWAQVRKSNTEPIYRLIVETQSARTGREIVNEIEKILR